MFKVSQNIKIFLQWTNFLIYVSLKILNNYQRRLCFENLMTRVSLSREYCKIKLAKIKFAICCKLDFCQPYSIILFCSLFWYTCINLNPGYWKSRTLRKFARLVCYQNTCMVILKLHNLKITFAYSIKFVSHFTYSIRNSVILDLIKLNSCRYKFDVICLLISGVGYVCSQFSDKSCIRCLPRESVQWQFCDMAGYSYRSVRCSVYISDGPRVSSREIAHSKLGISDLLGESRPIRGEFYWVPIWSVDAKISLFPPCSGMLDITVGSF